MLIINLLKNTKVVFKKFHFENGNIVFIITKLKKILQGVRYK